MLTEQDKKKMLASFDLLSEEVQWSLFRTIIAQADLNKENVSAANHPQRLRLVVNGRGR